MIDQINYAIIRAEETLGGFVYEASKREDNKDLLEKIRLTNNILYSLKHCREEYKEMENVGKQ